jgi:hypothetical protein
LPRELDDANISLLFLSHHALVLLVRLFFGFK